MTERTVGRRGHPVTRHRVYDAVVELWSQLGRPPLRKEVATHLGLGETVVKRATILLMAEGRLSDWMVPAGHRAVLVPLTATPPSV